jgi:hypothetical protein
LLFIDENQQNINNQYNINFRAKYGKIPDICKHYKKTKFPPDTVLSTSGGSSIFITREFQRHRDRKKPNFLSVCYRKKKIKSRV